MGDAGTKCPGEQLITSQVACESAARYLGLKDLSPSIFPSAEGPRGCYYTTNYALGLNTDSVGSSGHSEILPVCLAAGSIEMLMLINMHINGLIIIQ